MAHIAMGDLPAMRGVFQNRIRRQPMADIDLMINRRVILLAGATHTARIDDQATVGKLHGSG